MRKRDKRSRNDGDDGAMFVYAEVGLVHSMFRIDQGTQGRFRIRLSCVSRSLRRKPTSGGRGKARLCSCLGQQCDTQWCWRDQKRVEKLCASFVRTEVWGTGGLVRLTGSHFLHVQARVCVIRVLSVTAGGHMLAEQSALRTRKWEP